VLRVLFTLKGSIVKRIALRCLMVTLLAALIVLVERHFPAFSTRSAPPHSPCWACRCRSS
jgi:predicted membrane chloride channel (bestrophin family)